MSRFSVGNFLSHNAESFRRGILYCCINFGYRKSLGKKGGVSIKIVRRKSFVSQCRKKFVGEPFCVPEKFWCRKLLGTREGRISQFPVEIFCLTLPKKFVGEPFSISLISGIENFYNSEGYVTISDFLLKFSVSQCQNFRRGIFYCCINFGYQRSLDKGVGCQDFPSEILCLTMRKVSVRESFTVALISGTGKVWVRKGE